MQRKFNINVDGRQYNVVVEEEAGFAPTTAWRSTVPLTVVPPTVPQAANAPVAEMPAPKPAAAPAASPAAAPVASGAGEVTAPLAGVVDSIEVRVGQSVAVGDRVAVIEAMKMKTDVFAKVAGTVQRVAVKSHDSVDTGQALLSIG